MIFLFNYFSSLLLYVKVACLVMADPIKLFQFIRNFYQKIGMNKNRGSPRRILFNLKNVLIILAMLQMFIATSSYFLFKAKRLDEMGLTFYVSNTLLAAISYFVLNIYHNENILVLMEKYDELINRSKLKLWIEKGEEIIPEIFPVLKL